MAADAWIRCAIIVLVAGVAGAADVEVVDRFAWEHVSAPWHLLLWAGAAAAAGWWAWRRYGPTPPGWRGPVARTARVLGLILLIAAIAGPSWQRTTTTWLPGRMVIAVDRSSSMARDDGEGGARRIAAASALARILAKPEFAGLHPEWRAIGAGASNGPIAVQDLLAADARQGIAAEGASSPLAEDLDRLAGATRPDLLVVVSDFRVTNGPDLAALAQTWTAERRHRDLPVHLLPVGGERIDPELWIDEVAVNPEAAVGEREPVRIRATLRAPPQGEVRFQLEADGQPAGDKTVAIERPGKDDARLIAAEATLEAVALREGQLKLVAIVRCGDLVQRRELSISARERKLQVLMLEARPRYDSRYLQVALKRDRTITVHAYLGEGRWRRWSDAGPAQLPLTPAELAAYDAIVLGDLGPESFKTAEIEAIARAVRKNGTGLVLIPGETGALAAWAGTPLESLLPITTGDAATIRAGYLDNLPRSLSRTALAANLGLLDSGAEDGGLDWGQLPPLLGACPVASVRAGAQVLAEDQDRRPLVAVARHGAGTVAFIGTDTTYLWRRNVGDRYLHRFHSQILRFVAQGRRRGQIAWRLFAAPRRAVPGETIAIHLAPLGEGDAPADAVAVRLSGQATNGQAGVEQLARLAREGAGFSARINAPSAGVWKLDVAAGIDPRTVDTSELLVLPPTSELRDPRVDRAGADAFARACGGQVHADPAALAARLPKQLRNAEIVTVPIGLWDAWWTLVLAILFFGVDWALRRLSRLP